jgi:heat shock protein HtpX
VKFAGGHDPGPLAIPEFEYEDAPGEAEATTEDGPWGHGQPQPGGAKPFLPSQPPVDLGGPSSPGPNTGTGPWGPRRN